MATPRVFLGAAAAASSHIRFNDGKQEDLWYHRAFGDLLLANTAYEVKSSSSRTRSFFSTSSSWLVGMHSRAPALCEDVESKTNECFFAATHGNWSREWDHDWDGRAPGDEHTKNWMKGKLKLPKKEKVSSEFVAGDTGSNDGKATMGAVETLTEDAKKSPKKPDHPFTKAAPKSTVRHIFLIRHGQYNIEDNAEPELTELGKLQSRKTGERLKAMADGLKKDHYGEVKISWKRVISSGLSRAKQTADIIADILDCKVEEYDPLLNEGTPCLTHPSGSSLEEQSKSEKLPKLLADPPRIEAAYRKYVHRKQNWKRLRKDAERSAKKKIDETFEGKDANKEESGGSDVSEDIKINHEYEVIVCHMNVIRYFVVRALQLPPEAWLRFRGDNCGITEILVYEDGRVSLGRFGDQGHLLIEETTFH